VLARYSDLDMARAVHRDATRKKASTMHREAFEFALDNGRLETRYYEFLLNDTMFKWHLCRRDGPTRILGRDGHTRFIIPIQFKLNDLASISNAEFLNGHVDMWFRIIRGRA
jgi:hypothetical protein